MTRNRPSRKELALCTGCGSHRPAAQMVAAAAGTFCRDCVRSGRTSGEGSPK